MITIIVVVIYCTSLALIFAFSLGQLHLVWHYKRNSESEEKIIPLVKEELPSVTVQLPIYNEKYVIKRLLEAVTSFDYPRDRLEIQVLDDSDDETFELISTEVKNYQYTGIDIKHVRRKERTGFKAGALDYGISFAKGEFIAIFDADFLPKSDFLKKTLPYFSDEEIGVVQTRWGHLNRDYSLLTKLQAFGLDAHFSVEQVGRSKANSYINFNGTGGVWRKSCIYDAGGWSSDTLTEDLDLSYRAQLKGWKFRYLEKYEAPAELPILMPAIKSQQYRWNKGAAETARKNLFKVLTSPKKAVNKVHAIFHLLNSSVFVCLLIAALMSIPMLAIKESHPEYELLFKLGSVFLIGFFSIAIFYWVSAKSLFGKKTLGYYSRLFPAFLIVSMGLSLHNAIAVIEGLFGIKSDFIRTPKFNVFNKKEGNVKNSYLKPKLSPLTIIEGLLALYFAFGVYYGLYIGDGGLIIFHLMLAVGFALVFIYSLKAVYNVKSR